MNPPVHLTRRDRFALAFRLVGVIVSLALVIAIAATWGWSSAATLVLVALVIGAGALLYHLLTSIVRCPACAGRIYNLRIASDHAKRKLFHCMRCGAVAWLREGFYWQSDVSG